MHGNHLTHIDDPGPARIPSGVPLVFLGVGIVSLLIFLLAAFRPFHGTTVQQAWAGFLISYLFFWTISLGAASFLAINYIVGAKWYIVIKRPLEALAAFAWQGGFAFPIIGLLGTGVLYSWAQPDPYYPYAGTVKAMWLTPGLHYVKVFIYVLLLSGMTWLLVNTSTAADKRHDPKFREKQLRNGIAYMIVFAPVFSLFCVDVIKALEPKWFSTMWGVYCFIGGLLAALAAAMLMSYWLKAKVPHAVHERQMYDLGTFVMGFSVFMIYIGFSQFMLIWYANLHDETFYFMARYEGGWFNLTIALPILKWLIPFFVLMPSSWRTNVVAQGIVCTSILVGQLADVYWMVAPAIPLDGNFAGLEEGRQAWLPSIVNLITFIGVAGVFAWSTLTFLGRHSVLPVGDPDLLNSVNGEYLHA